MKKLLLPISIIFLAISVIFGSLWISNAINKQPKKVSDIGAKALMTEQQAADYLGISKSTFDKVFTSLNDQRKQLTSYDDYVYIPYIKIGSAYLFQKNELAKWAAYNEENYTEIKLN